MSTFWCHLVSSAFLPITIEQGETILFCSLHRSAHFFLSRSFLSLFLRENNRSLLIDKLQRVAESKQESAKESAYVSRLTVGYHTEHKDDLIILLMSNNDIHDHRYLIDFNRHSLDR